jgi:enoyl-[acyl-carrier-protein] reductase (NADH)
MAIYTGRIKKVYTGMNKKWTLRNKNALVTGGTKAAINPMTTNLASEWATDAKRINAIAGCYIKTPLSESVLSNPAYRKLFLAPTPIGRIRKPEEILHLVSFLSIPVSSYITGQSILVDSGFTKNLFLKFDCLLNLNIIEMYNNIHSYLSFTNRN